MVESKSPQRRQPTGKLMWKGISLFVTLVAAASAVWFFLTAEQLNERAQDVGGSDRGAHTQVNGR
ncbi:hypothetical protein [Asticcacaulis sp. AND118]|uniref:hypothetical protein n=1 Tax=Asticcacaulis sp. AND118 TaxID=2840468 RepID=UPI001CFFAFC8|nr:hypothetical protein [Asticcacaulis sp. AND118]UDF05233.1 hypothetical protein LH365_17750 [Asticcacaulis sp. AND118]